MKSERVIKSMMIIILVFCLLGISYNIIEEPQEKEKEISKEELDIITWDNRVSPLTNQGLILEINRIRHRGLLDSIMKIGNSWRDKPEFYVVTNIDDGEYSSYEEYGFTYNTWDTINQDFRIIRDVEEERDMSDITITIVEQEKKGVLRKNNIEREKLHLTYDYRTGRWFGSDYFDDIDGYGHYLGETFEIWFNVYQTDYDQDGIPYWTEVNILNTDPRVDDSKLDPDKDGIPTSWEWKWDYNPNIWDDHENLDPDIDGLENIEEYEMRNWFANPFSQDIYIEVDEMQRNSLFDIDHVLYEESKQIIIERFSRHNINVYIDNGWPSGILNGGGEFLPPVDKKISWDSGKVLQYYKYHFPEERNEIFRHTLICGNSKPPAYCGNAVFNRFDTIVISTEIKQLHRVWLTFSPRAIRLVLASVFLHELGHSLGIGPNTIEGCDNSSFKNRFLPIKERTEYLKEWGNYKSSMNYYYIYSKNVADYSDGSHGYNDQNDWEKIYLPFFQIEADVVVDPFYYPLTKEGIDENVTIDLEGWSYSKELTETFVNDISGWSPIDPIKCEWSVFIKGDEGFNPSDRNIRIYAKPKVPFAVWTLYREGYLISQGVL